MPKPAKVQITPPQVTQSAEVISSSEVKVKTSICVTMSANYQSIKLECGVEFDCKRDDVKNGYGRAWDLVNTEVANNMKDAKQVLQQLG